VIEEDPIRTDRRRRRRQERFGCANPSCVLCGRPDLEKFTQETSNWLYKHGIELHHVMIKAHDPDLVVPLCLNCHREVTEGLAQAGVSDRPEPNPVRRAIHMLNALAVFLEYLAVALRRLVEELKEFGASK
jgi:5-methylcytosine-specific restriction endonuclease McrA